MTFPANRNNIKAMFDIIPIMVMIMFCLIWATSTFEVSRWFDFAGFNSIFYSVMSNCAFWMTNLVASCISSICSLAFFSLFVLFIILPKAYLPFFAMVIFSFSSFAFVSFVIPSIVNYMTFFAITSVSIFLCFIFVKLRKRFDLLALKTSFVNGSHSPYCILPEHFVKE